MFYLLNWFVVLGLLTMWSLAAWAFHAVAVWTIANAGVLVSGSSVSDGVRLPDWLAPWVPSELVVAVTSMAAALKPVVDTLLGWAPSLSGGLSVAVWVIWAIGAVMLIVLGVVISTLIAVLRRRSATNSAPRLGPSAGR